MLNYPFIKLLGRYIQKENGTYFSFSGSGVEFDILAKENAEVVFTLLSITKENNNQYILITVNGKQYSKEKLHQGKNEIKILFKESHLYTIRLIKLNEAYYSSLVLEDVSFSNAEFIKINFSRKKLIGFFGDSLTCGYGLSKEKKTKFSLECDDFSLSYPYLLSTSLDLDYEVVAKSGISVALPIYWNQLFKDIYDTVDLYEKYFASNQLDFAVINLGSNDSSALNLINDSEKEYAIKQFENEYLKLIDKIVRDNENLKIIMVYNFVPLNEHIIDSIKKVFDIARSKYSNVFKLIELSPNTDGVDFHPNPEAHRLAFKQIKQVIEDVE